jgi:hypothetical protein
VTPRDPSDWLRPIGEIPVITRDMMRTTMGYRASLIIEAVGLSALTAPRVMAVSGFPRLKYLQCDDRAYVGGLCSTIASVARIERSEIRVN